MGRLDNICTVYQSIKLMLINKLMILLIKVFWKVFLDLKDKLILLGMNTVENWKTKYSQTTYFSGDMKSC